MGLVWVTQTSAKARERERAHTHTHTHTHSGMINIFWTFEQTQRALKLFSRAGHMCCLSVRDWNIFQHLLRMKCNNFGDALTFLLSCASIRLRSQFVQHDQISLAILLFTFQYHLLFYCLNIRHNMKLLTSQAMFLFFIFYFCLSYNSWYIIFIVILLGTGGKMCQFFFFTLMLLNIDAWCTFLSPVIAA